MADIILESRYPVVLTGAGMSTESGIPDFRSPETGLWEKMDPEDFTIESFTSDPARIYELSYGFFQDILDAKPNTGHKVLGELQARGIIKMIITQNIDSLHQKGGAYRVLEVHGSLSRGVCLECEKKINMGQVLKAVNEGQNPPLCTECNSLIKPDIVLFGEQLPEAFEIARKEVLKSDCLIIIGSSLEVAPVCFLPRLSKNILIINKGRTSVDDSSKVLVRKKAGEALSMLWEEISSREFVRTGLGGVNF